MSEFGKPQPANNKTPQCKNPMMASRWPAGSSLSAGQYPLFPLNLALWSIIERLHSNRALTMFLHSLVTPSESFFTQSEAEFPSCGRLRRIEEHKKRKTQDKANGGKQKKRRKEKVDSTKSTPTPTPTVRWYERDGWHRRKTAHRMRGKIWCMGLWFGSIAHPKKREKRLA